MANLTLLTKRHFVLMLFLSLAFLAFMAGFLSSSRNSNGLQHVAYLPMPKPLAYQDEGLHPSYGRKLQLSQSRGATPSNSIFPAEKGNY